MASVSNTFTEIFNVGCLDYILAHREFYERFLLEDSESQKAPVFELLRKYGNKKGKKEVVYSRVHGRGRQFAAGGLSLQSFPRVVRGGLARGLYYDLDFVNAHPTIISRMCRDRGFVPTFLSSYISDRDAVIGAIADANPDHGYASIKKAILAVIYGGLHDYKRIRNKTNWMRGFRTEVEQIHAQVKTWFPEEYELQKTLKSGQQFQNLDGSALSASVCVVEDQLLEEMLRYLRAIRAIKNTVVLTFDGAMVPIKALPTEEKLTKAIRGIEGLELFKRYNIKVKTKEFEALPLPPDSSLPSVVLDDATDRLFQSDFSDSDMAEYVLHRHPDFIFYDERLFKFNGVYWKASDISVLYTLIGALHAPLSSELENAYPAGRFPELNAKCVQGLAKLQSTRGVKNVAEYVKWHATIDASVDIWDQDAYLLCFQNGVYELKTGMFREGRKEDYVTQALPHSYEGPNDAEIAWLTLVLEKIMPIPEEREWLLRCLSTGLDGMLLPHITFLIGSGRNGKDTVINVMRALLGHDMFYDAPGSLVSEKQKTGANPEVASLDKKRTVVIAEPPRNSTLNCDIVKRLTGCDFINARGLYSGVTRKRMCSSQFILLNRMLPMDAPDNAMRDRIIVIEFKARFVSPPDMALYADTKYVHEVDTYYKSQEFIRRAAMPLLHILLSHYRKFMEDGFRLVNTCAGSLRLAAQHLRDADDFVGWFHDVYEFSGNEDDHVRLRDVFGAYKCGDLYLNLSKTERRRVTYSKFVKDISENPSLKQYHVERCQKGGKNMKNFIRMYRPRSLGGVGSEEED